jgi:hypothetical protein
VPVAIGGGRSGLSDAQVKSLSPAYASILQNVAGRVRILAELAAGSSWFGLEGPAAPRNPDGNVGVNGSGPPFGSALRHPLWVMGGVKADVSGDCTGQRLVGNITTATPLTVNIRYRSRHFTKKDKAPYSRVYLTGMMFRTAGASFAVTVALDTGPGTPARSTTFTCSSTTPAAFDLTTIYWDVLDGLRYQFHRVTFSIAAAASGCSIESLCGYQRVKRAHP